MSTTALPPDDDRLDSERILARLALEAQELEAQQLRAAEIDPERSGLGDEAALHAIWRRLDEETKRENPVPADRLRARFYRSLAAWQAEAQRPSPLHRVERWLAGVWPKSPLVQLATAVATLLLGVVVGLAIDRQDAEIGALRAELTGELRTMNTRAALGLLDDASAADRLRGVSLSAQALADPRQSSQRIVDELLRIATADQSENVRLAAVEALARVADQASVRQGLAASLGRQHSPVLQVAVADVLAERGGADGERALRELLADPEIDPAVKARVYELVAASFGGTL
ncbi:MAG TPA: hypothetical protein VMT85_14645 [Thermoanaerobaculia bacterium]|nr:hypothetical protein [Thermoanaerobaculia bacterium]